VLVITRKENETVFIGKDVQVYILEIKGNKVRVGILAPSEISIYRTEEEMRLKEYEEETTKMITSLKLNYPGKKI
jgi:carbon storage regulator